MKKLFPLLMFLLVFSFVGFTQQQKDTTNRKQRDTNMSLSTHPGIDGRSHVACTEEPPKKNGIPHATGKRPRIRERSHECGKQPEPAPADPGNPPALPPYNRSYIETIG